MIAVVTVGAYGAMTSFSPADGSMERGEGVMSHHHSRTYSFQLVLGGVLHDCNFFLTDDRMITVTVGGRRRSEMLCGAPPRALATTIAIELLRERPVTALASELITHQERRTWLDRLFGRSIEHSAQHQGDVPHQGLN